MQKHHFYVCITTKNAWPKSNRKETQDELGSESPTEGKGLCTWNLSKTWKEKGEEIWKKARLKRDNWTDTYNWMEMDLWKRLGQLVNGWGLKDLDGYVMLVTSLTWKAI